MTFTDTENFLYNTEENLWIYDSKTGKSVSVYEFENSSYISYRATPDLSKIFVRESAKGVSSYPLYEVKPDGTKTLIDDNVKEFYLDGETFYYMTPPYDLYIYENGNSEKVFPFGEHFETIINQASFESHSSGYLMIAVYADSKEDDDYISAKSFLSTDGRNFVCVEDYLK
jgi:hypothetical protein